MWCLRYRHTHTFRQHPQLRPETPPRRRRVGGGRGWDGGRPGESAQRHTLKPMCGRYAASARPDELIEAFDIDEDRSDEPARSILKNPQHPAPGEPDWNMAPPPRSRRSSS